MTLLGATKWQFLRCIKVYMAPFENLAAQQEWNLSNCKPGWSERSSSYIFFAGLTRYYTSKLLTVTHIELVNISSIYFHGIWNYSIIKSQISKWNYFLGNCDERTLFTVTWICRSCSIYFLAMSVSVVRAPSNLIVRRRRRSRLINRKEGSQIQLISYFTNCS